MSQQDLPLISVIVPSYNYGRYIERTIRSVLYQDYPAKELIVVDGGSTDETLDVLRRYPQIKWVSEPDKGIPDAINKGLVRASGQIIGIQSCDDYYTPGAFSCTAKIFKENPDAWLVSGHHIFINKKLRITGVARMSEPLNLRRFLEMQVWPTAGRTFYRRDAIEKVGLNVNADVAWEYDLGMRLLSYRDGVVVNQPLGFFLLHSDSLGHASAERFSTGLGSAISDWLSSDQFPSELRGHEPWIEAGICLRQTLYLNRAGLVKEAASKLMAARKTFPDCEKWPMYCSLATYCGLAKYVALLPARIWTRTYWLTISSGFSALRSGQFQLILNYLRDAVSLKLRSSLPDPEWVYKEDKSVTGQITN